jgi:hypothetical protein
MAISTKEKDRLRQRRTRRQSKQKSGIFVAQAVVGGQWRDNGEQSSLAFGDFIEALLV